MDPLLPILGPLGVLAAGLGVFYAIFTSNRVKTTIEVYEKENTAQGRRINTLEEDNRLRDVKITALERQNETLRDLATGKTAVEAFALVYERTQQERANEHRVVLEVLRSIDSRLPEPPSAFLGPSSAPKS